MMECTICHKRAEYRSNNIQIKANKKEYISLYCRQHKEEGLEFGWIEEGELERIE